MTEHLPRRLQQLLQAELAPDERITWTGRPSPSRRAAGQIGTCAIGAVWTACCAFGVHQAATGFGNATAPKGVIDVMGLLWFGAFTSIGVVIFLSPVFGWWTALRTVYAITGRRALIIEADWRGVTVWSFQGNKMDLIVRRTTGEGNGDLILGREVREGAKRAHLYDVGFFGIDNVKQVHALADALRASLHPASV